MSDLTDALARLEGVNVRADRPTYYEDRVAFAAIVAAARRVAEAPEVWWCEEHEAPDDTDGDWGDDHRWCIVEGEWGMSNPANCRMVRKLLVDPDNL